jgi:hypothetical protein
MYPRTYIVLRLADAAADPPYSRGITRCWRHASDEDVSILHADACTRRPVHRPEVCLMEKAQNYVPSIFRVSSWH